MLLSQRSRVSVSVEVDEGSATCPFFLATMAFSSWLQVVPHVSSNRISVSFLF